MKSISKPKSKKLKRFDNSLLKEDAKILFTENPESSENNREIFGESFKEFGRRTGLIIIRNSKPTEDDIDYPKGTRCIIKNNTTLIYELKENKWIRIFDFDSLVTAKILCPLGPDGLIPSENLSLEALEFKGRWDPNKNEPELRDGVGTLGDTYFALNSKSFDFGHGLVPVYKNGAVIYNGEKWFTFNSSYARSVNETNPDEHGNANLDAKLIPYNKENVERSLENIEDYDIVIHNQEEFDELQNLDPKFFNKRKDLIKLEIPIESIDENLLKQSSNESEEKYYLSEDLYCKSGQYYFKGELVNLDNLIESLDYPSENSDTYINICPLIQPPKIIYNIFNQIDYEERNYLDYLNPFDSILIQGYLGIGFLNENQGLLLTNKNSDDYNSWYYSTHGGGD